MIYCIICVFLTYPKYMRTLKTYGVVSIGLLLTIIGEQAIAIESDEEDLGTVIVIGKPEDITNTELVGSVDVLTRDEIVYEHVNDTLELFNKVPGVYLARYNQGIINTDIAIRGFAGDGVTPHGKLLIDGIPSNLHNGYNELDQLFPLGISSIEVFKGTSDPRYGLYNIAGNYNVATRQDIAKELELTVGSFNTQEIQGYAGFSDDDFTHNYAFGYRTGEGYRDQTDLDKLSFSGSWNWQIGDNKDLRIVARHATYEGDSPGYFNSPEDARENPRGSEPFARLDGGEKQTDHLSVHWSQELGNDIEWTFKAYTQSFERERWVRFSEGGSLTNRYDDQEQIGLLSTLKWFISDDWQLNWGVDYAYEDVLEQRFSTISNDSRQRAAAFRDRAYDFSNFGTYLQISHQFNDKLHWNLAVRADRLRGDFIDQLNDQSRDMYDFGTIIQPKLNVVYAVTDNVNLFMNAGRSFQHPFGASAYTSGDRNARDVSINDGWEMGTQISASSALTVRISYWQQNASDEFINIDGTAQNVGETDRSGFDIAFNGEINHDWSYWGNFTTIDTEIVKAADSIADSQGNNLRSIPDFTASIGLNYHVTDNFIARIHVDAQGDYHINEANVGGQFGDFTLLNASADYDAGWGVIKFQLNNITDEYYEYAFDFGNDADFTIHSPGAGINGSVSVNWNF